MKIQINNQIFEIDEKTLFEWLKMGRIPEDAYVFSETLTNGQWKPVHELDWRILPHPTRTISTAPRSADSEFAKERKFFVYQQKRPVVTIGLVVLNTIIFLWLDRLVGGSENVRKLIQFGAYSYPLIIDAGEYWRLVTNIFVHIGILHFFLNMIPLCVFGYLFEGVYGSWRYLILYIFAGLGGSLASLPFVRIAISAGASGAIFGLAGAMVVFGFRYRRQLPRRQKFVYYLILAIVGCEVIVGPLIVPHINSAAHVGGLIVGGVVGLLLPPMLYANREHEGSPVRIAGMVLITLAIFSSAFPVFSGLKDTPEIVEKRMRTAFPTPSIRANLHTSIEGYEKWIQRHGYAREYYEHLEALYMQARVLAPEKRVSWDRKLERLYQKGIAADSRHATWYNNLAWLYVEQKSYPTRAFRLAYEAVKAQPTSTTFLDTLGWAYLRDHQYGKSLRAFEQVFVLPVKGEMDLQSRQSSWQGIAELIQEDITPQKSAELVPSFLKFYNRLSRQFADQPESQKQLQDAFERFQSRYGGLIQ